MDKQELLECITGYLPYDLQAIVKIKGKEQKLSVKYYHVWEWLSKNIESKPILRPLSDLTKPCLEGDKVPIEELGKIYEPEGSFEEGYFGWNTATGGDDYQDYYYVINDKLKVEIWCGNPEDGGYCTVEENLPLESYQWLYKNHFDIHNLIGRGYAIDINTLK